MILPSRPLRIDPLFVRHCWQRALGFLAPGLALFFVAGMWQGRAAYELAMDQRAWREGERLEVTSVETNVAIVAALSRHVRITATFEGEDQEQWVVRDDYWTLLTDSVGDGPLEVRFDASTQRIALSWSMEAAGWRWGWIVFFGLVLGGFGAFLWGVAWRALRALRLVRSAARDSDEVELEVIEVTRRDESIAGGSLDVTYRVPPVASQESVDYRHAAATASSVHTAHFEGVDRGPIMLDGGAHMLGLRSKLCQGEVTVLRTDFWPFLLTPAERASAATHVEQRV